MIPTLVAITLIAFGFLALVPLDPTVSSRVARDDETLPLFLNPQPRDVRSIATTAVARIARGDAPQEAAEPLVRAGGAALPFVLPALDALSPDERARVALALAPVAVRMGILGPEGFRTAADAVLFWSRFWEERSVDFKTSVVRRAVR
ncbi:MAG TPA: ABC transporter permease, partial [Polyangiaceae bacterium]|nr:ABC transporter permease [Polyangiaceae bacterium]